MDRRVLYISQTGMTEPLGRSQVVPYLVGLTKVGWSFDLIALEPAGTSESLIAATRSELGNAGIRYLPSRRSASHDRLVKISEMAGALFSALSLARRTAPRIVHARSDLPFMVAALLGRALPSTKTIYDCRGFLADEYADTGYWGRRSLNYRVLRRVERSLYARADAVVTLTERARKHLVDEQHWVDRTTPFAVVPCCVDVARYRADNVARVRARSRLEAGDRFVLVYSGSLGSWYCEEEMALLVAELRQRRPTLFVAYTRSNADRLRRALVAVGLSPGEFRIEARAPAEMPAALAAGDAAVSFAKPSYSKIASSPVKVAEYLAAGLPVIVNRGVGDADAQLEALDVFADAGLLDPGSIARGAEQLLRLAAEHDVAKRCVDAAVSTFDLERIGVPRYHALYERLVR